MFQCWLCLFRIFFGCKGFDYLWAGNRNCDFEQSAQIPKFVSNSELACVTQIFFTRSAPSLGVPCQKYLFLSFRNCTFPKLRIAPQKHAYLCGCLYYAEPISSSVRIFVQDISSAIFVFLFLNIPFWDSVPGICLCHFWISVLKYGFINFDLYSHCLLNPPQFWWSLFDVCSFLFEVRLV